MLFIGDSFAKIFSHQKYKSHDEVFSFPGRRVIDFTFDNFLSVIDRSKHSHQQLILLFGSNDIYLQFYYNVVKTNIDPYKYLDTFINQTVDHYISLIHQILALGTFKKVTVIPPFPSQIRNEYFLSTLQRYCFGRDLLLENLPEPILSNEFRNELLSRLTKILNLTFTSPGICRILDLHEHFNDDMRMKDPTDMHYRYEPLVSLYRESLNLR